jgi:DNA-3-methyladenine glycosylase
MRATGTVHTFTPLARSFYKPSAAMVAPRLLGHWLVRNTDEGPCGGIIVETEAYLRDDPACHAAPGPTARNRAMFGEPGRAYVYFIYGNHFCVNAVCRPVGVGEAVLIRAIEPAFGENLLRRNRPCRNPLLLSNGPGKLCAAMGIDRALDHADLCDATSPLFIAENPALDDTLSTIGPVKTTPRIGITKAAELPLRFFLAGSRFVSQR